jgi:predicted dehydrogenase
MRVGLIGCGHHGRNAVVPGLTKFSQRAKLVAACDLSQELVSQVPEVTHYVDHQQMIRQEKLDLVYVATLADTHAAITIDALNTGAHVICEKPMANTLTDCESMAAAARQAARYLFVNFETRLYPHIRLIKQWIGEGRLGRVEAIHLEHFWDGHKTTGPYSERRARLMAQAGGLDCGIHKLDLARYLAGSPSWQSLHAVGAWFGENMKFAPHIAVMGRFDNGVMTTVNTSMGFASQIKTRPYTDSLIVIGNKGIINASIPMREMSQQMGAHDVVELFTDDGREVVQRTHHTHIQTIGWLADEAAKVVIDGQPIPDGLASGDDGVQAQWATERANTLAASERSESVTSSH